MTMAARTDRGMSSKTGVRNSRTTMTTSPVTTLATPVTAPMSSLIALCPSAPVVGVAWNIDPIKLAAPMLMSSCDESTSYPRL